MLFIDQNFIKEILYSIIKMVTKGNIYSSRYYKKNKEKILQKKKDRYYNNIELYRERVKRNNKKIKERKELWKQEIEQNLSLINNLSNE